MRSTRPRVSAVWVALVFPAAIAGVGGAWTTAPVTPAARVEAAAPQDRPVFRRADVRPSLTTPSADARESQRRWATDFPKADRQFLTIIDRLVDLDAYEPPSGSTTPTSGGSPSSTRSKSATCT